MLYAFALGLQLILLLCRLVRMARAHRSRAYIVRWLVVMFVHAAPPSIPTIFLVLTHIARTRLDRAGLTLLFSKALRTGANINMVCFDKTGTLTDSAVRFFFAKYLFSIIVIASIIITIIIIIIVIIIISALADGAHWQCGKIPFGNSGPHALADDAR